MTHLKMDFAADAALTLETAYTVECLNQSPVPWYFFLYQQLPQQPGNVLSLAWMASPFKIAPGARISFRFSPDYNFLWAATGMLQPGVIASASQIVSCNPVDANQTTFSVNDNTPSISEAMPGGQPGNLTIGTAANVPNMTYATGIGMSGSGTFLMQAMPNTMQVYAPHPIFRVASANQIQTGQVLDQSIAGGAEIVFPPNVYKVYATLSNQQTWTVSQTPPSVAQSNLQAALS